MSTLQQAATPSHGKPAPAGLVLCGGAGRRVGGRDKGLLTVNGTPAVVLAARLLAAHCHPVIVSANRHLDCYRELGIGPVVRDRRAGHAGPLAGVEAAAAVMQSDRLLLLPCDMPLLDVTVPGTLLAALDADERIDAVYASAWGRDHYLVAGLRARAAQRAAEALDRGEHAVRHWLNGLATRRVDFAGVAATGFSNRNDSAAWGSA